ncbi:hypothetical protein BD289DRAFT_484477 [Coniella lustricola]|uniref:SET domain-containing protein n=1 Tax=Coniella lustricola TaxID=2025994 RepID=A0A2T3A1Z8_9PEZI|nr:hypothetical protein BD289DRAFT_484477 [Coniella lustricola]
MFAAVWHDRHFPEMRNNLPALPYPWVAQGYRKYAGGPDQDGTIKPGIMDVANLFGNGAFSGLPHRPRPPPAAGGLANGADMIVTILYQHRPSLLRRFLGLPAGRVLTYTHRPIPSDQQPGASGPDKRAFVIQRKGRYVEAGFRTSTTDNRATWDEAVGYEIMPTGSWRQVFYRHPQAVPTSAWDILATAAMSHSSGHHFEDIATCLLKPAITQRLWHSYTGHSIIEITEEEDKVTVLATHLDTRSSIHYDDSKKDEQGSPIACHCTPSVEFIGLQKLPWLPVFVWSSRSLEPTRTTADVPEGDDQPCITGYGARLSDLAPSHQYPQLQTAEAPTAIMKYPAMYKALTEMQREAFEQSTERNEQLTMEYLAMAMEASKVASHDDNEIKTTTMDDAYLPCTEPLDSLRPVLLKDLLLETHNRGRVVFLKTMDAPVRMISIRNTVEDSAGDVERLAIYNLPSQTPADQVLPRGAVLAIKEPYYRFTDDGGVAIRVDHPSDFVLLNVGDERVPSQWRVQPKTPLTASELKQKGNDAAVKKKWEEAASYYSKALLALPTGNDKDGHKNEEKDNNEADVIAELCRNLYRNRAQARLQMGHVELAAQDAIASIIPGTFLSEASQKLNHKALYRAGRAYYEMGACTQAEHCFKQAVWLGIRDANVIYELVRTKKRLIEQNKGTYDFTAMSASANEPKDTLDHASFIANTKAFHVATADAERRKCAIFLHDSTNTGCALAHAERLYGALAKLRWNPQLASKYLNLFAGPAYPIHNKESSAVDPAKPAALVVDGSVVLDAFRVQTVAQYNDFGCPEVKSTKSFVEETEQPDHEATGIWLHASYVNHSCLQNTLRAFIGDMMIVRAFRDIKAGEEIFMSYYIHDETPKVPASIMAKRISISQEANHLVNADEANMTGSARKMKIKEAEKLYTQLEATYDQTLYGNMPRSRLVNLDVWIIHSKGLGEVAEAIVSLGRLLRNVGIFTIHAPDGLTIDRTNAMIMREVFHGAIYSAQVWAEVPGYGKVARDYVDFAKEMYMDQMGEMHGFQEKFGEFLPDI